MKQFLSTALVFLSILGFSNITQALPSSIEASGEELTLNGEGVRTKFALKIYKGGLYLKNKSTDAKTIIEADELMAIRMEVVSGLLNEDNLTETVREGFEMSTGSKTAMKKEIDMLIGSFAKDIKKGDISTLVYEPGVGLSVYKNGVKGNVIEGLAFKQALFRIWLGEEPAQKSLKEDMLGL